MTFITCIDVLWEAIQQLHRVFFDTDTMPYDDKTEVFQHRLFVATDNDYFKTIRACFATHPINLNDVVFNGGHIQLVSMDMFKACLSDHINFENIESIMEFYVIMKAGFFMLNRGDDNYE